jgi:hypothetical protein
MSIDELEAEALKLDPKARAKLAGKLLESLENLSDAENAQLWSEEAGRRAAQLHRDPTAGRPADEVFRDAHSDLK